MMYYPVPAIGLFGGYLIYKTIFWGGYFSVIWPTIPLSLLVSMRYNIMQNCAASIERIELL
jgi:hypothetical protein